MRTVFLGAVGIIVKDLAAGTSLYVDALGLPLKRIPGATFRARREWKGSRYLGVWSLADAAKACFGRTRWPKGRPVPQMFLELEVVSPAHVARAAIELEARGHRLLHGPRTDPWGQTVARLQTADGLIVGVSYVPWMHRRPRARAGARRRTPGPRRRAARPSRA
jgi:catechol 2,3-dioxygenase-like lactoylglutathione lyase family enzyme